eukprot:7378922-Prymnesium_polylepis.3
MLAPCELLSRDPSQLTYGVMMRRAIGGARGGPKASGSVSSGLPSSLSESDDAHSSGKLPPGKELSRDTVRLFSREIPYTNSGSDADMERDGPVPRPTSAAPEQASIMTTRPARRHRTRSVRRWSRPRTAAG